MKNYLDENGRERHEIPFAKRSLVYVQKKFELPMQDRDVCRLSWPVLGYARDQLAKC